MRYICHKTNSTDKQTSYKGAAHASVTAATNMGHITVRTGVCHHHHHHIYSPQKQNKHKHARKQRQAAREAQTPIMPCVVGEKSWRLIGCCCWWW